jgi:glycosyltransferase involved in cell wall biosynthesis
MKVSLLNLNLIGPDAIGSVIIKMARYYRDRGDEVRIFIGSPPRDVPDDIGQICRVTTLANLLRPRPGQGDQEDLFFHLSDLTVYNYPGYYDLLETIHGRERGAVLFAYYCATPPELASSDFERGLLMRGRAEAAHAHYADLTMVISPFGSAELRAQHAIPEARIRVVPLFAAHGDQLWPGEKPADLVAHYRLHDAPVLLYVGRFAANKDIATIIRALARLTPREPAGAAAKLVLVGDDRSAPMYREHADSLRELAISLGVDDRVIFAGPVERIADHYRLADVFVTASRHEGFCMPVVEAMSCGVPVVCANSTALPSTVGGAGLLFEPGDVDALAHAIDRLLGDEATRRDYARAGLERAAHFSPAQFDERIGQITSEVMTHVSRVPRSLTAAAKTAPVKVVVVGTDAAALRASDEITRRHAEIVCYVDDDVRKQGRTFLGRPVVGLDAIDAMTFDEIYLRSDRRAGMAKQLVELGLPEDRIRIVNAEHGHVTLSPVTQHVDAMRAAITPSGRRKERRPRVVIFGAGAGGQQAFKVVTRSHDVVAFADNDARKHGTELHGKPVVGIPQLRSITYDRIVVASIHFAEIQRQLQAAGIARDRIEAFAGR